jgi:uncharacterized membrane protein YcaP (DUF421 family)
MQPFDLILLVEHGRVIEHNLRRARMTHAELAAEARLQQVADVDSVRLARARDERARELHPRGAS